MVFKILFMTLADFMAQHIVWLLPIGIVVLVVLMPSVALAIFRFLTQTLPGQIILACLLTGLLVWFARGYIDDTAARRVALVAARAEVARADDLRRQADAKLAEVRRQVAASNQLLVEANDRAATNEAAVLSYQKRENDYEAELEKQPVARRCALDDADVRSLRRAAGAFRSVGETGAPHGPRKLWPTRRRP